MPNQPILEHLWIIPLLPLLGAGHQRHFRRQIPEIDRSTTVPLSPPGLSSSRP